MSKHYNQKASLEQELPTVTQKLSTTSECLLGSLGSLTSSTGKVRPTEAAANQTLRCPDSPRPQRRSTASWSSWLVWTERQDSVGRWLRVQTAPYTPSLVQLLPSQYKGVEYLPLCRAVVVESSALRSKNNGTSEWAGVVV